MLDLIPKGIIMNDLVIVVYYSLPQALFWFSVCYLIRNKERTFYGYVAGFLAVLVTCTLVNYFAWDAIHSIHAPRWLSFATAVCVPIIFSLIAKDILTRAMSRTGR